MDLHVRMTISHVYYSLVLFALYVYMCMCALIYSYTYMCVSCINEPQGITVRDEKNGWYFIDIGRRSHHDSHQKTRILLFLPRITPIPIYFHPIYFHSPRSHPRLCLYPIRVLSSRNILMLETRFRVLVLFPSPSSFSSSIFNSTNRTRTNRASFMISESLRFIFTLISFLFYLSCACSFFLSFTHSLFFIYSLLRLIVSELQNSTKCGNC